MKQKRARVVLNETTCRIPFRIDNPHDPEDFIEYVSRILPERHFDLVARAFVCKYYLVRILDVPHNLQTFEAVFSKKKPKKDGSYVMRIGEPNSAGYSPLLGGLIEKICMCYETDQVLTQLYYKGFRYVWIEY